LKAVKLVQIRNTKMNTKKKTNKDEKKSRSTTNQTETVEANIAKAPPAELNKENNTPPLQPPQISTAKRSFDLALLIHRSLNLPSSHF
jgi:hypothetical protein